MVRRFAATSRSRIFSGGGHHYIYIIYIPWPFPPVWGVADNTKETTKQWGFHSILLAMTRDPAEFGWHCWSNTAHPPLSSTTYVASYMPSPRLPLPHVYICMYVCILSHKPLTLSRPALHFISAVKPRAFLRAIFFESC